MLKIKKKFNFFNYFYCSFGCILKMDFSDCQSFVDKVIIKTDLFCTITDTLFWGLVG